MPSSTATSRSYTIRRLVSDVGTAFFGFDSGRFLAGFAGLPTVFARDAALAVFSPVGHGTGRLLFADGLPEDDLPVDKRSTDLRSPRSADRGFAALFGVSKRKRGLSRRVGVDGVLGSGIENSDGLSA